MKISILLNLGECRIEKVRIFDKDLELVVYDDLDDQHLEEKEGYYSQSLHKSVVVDGFDDVEKLIEFIRTGEKK